MHYSWCKNFHKLWKEALEKNYNNDRFKPDFKHWYLCCSEVGTMSAELIRVYPIKPGKQVMSIQTIVWRKKSFLFWTFLKLHFFLWKASLYFDHSEANIWNILYFCLLPERWARNKYVTAEHQRHGLGPECLHQAPVWKLWLAKHHFLVSTQETEYIRF